MKRLKFFLLALLLSGCAAMQRECKFVEADTMALRRTIVLYSSGGDTLKVWRCETTIEDSGGCFHFIGPGNKLVNVCGTLLSEED